MDEQTLAEIEEWIERLKDNHYRHEHTGFAWSIASKTPNLIAALRTAQAQLAQERERVRVLGGVAVTARDVLDDAHCTDRKHGSDFYVVMYEYIDRLEQALSAADEQVSSGNGNSDC